MHLDVSHANLKEAKEAIEKARKQDDNIYIDVISFSGNTNGIFDFCAEFTLAILNPEVWNVWKQEGDKIFEYFLKCGYSSNFLDITRFEYESFSNKHAYLQNVHPELFNQLEKSNVTSYFDLDEFIKDNNDITQLGSEIVYWSIE